MLDSSRLKTVEQLSIRLLLTQKANRKNEMMTLRIKIMMMDLILMTSQCRKQLKRSNIRHDIFLLNQATQKIKLTMGMKKVKNFCNPTVMFPFLTRFPEV